VNLQNNLLDHLPIIILDAGQHIQFAFLDVYLQQIDPFNYVLVNDIGECSELARDRLTLQPLCQQLINLLTR